MEGGGGGDSPRNIFSREIKVKKLPSDAIWNDVLKDGIAEKMLKTRKLNGAFWRYLKQCFQFSDLVFIFARPPTTTFLFTRLLYIISG